MTLRVVIVGGSGYIGQHLAAALVARGDDVVVLSRDPERALRRGAVNGRLVPWSIDDIGGLAGHLDGVDGVVNVTGVPVGPRPWTRGRRRAIRDSRLGPTKAVVDAMRGLAADRRPGVLVSVAGTDGYQGLDRVPATETTTFGAGFLADLCRDWEAAARSAEALDVRVAIVRNGFVIGPGAKALQLLALPFRLHLGGALGSGQQWMSWIHIDDVVGVMTMALDDERARGPFNAVSPEPVREADVAGAIGDVLGRRSWLSVPAPLIRLAMGEVSTLVLGTVRATPAHATELGYRFRWMKLRPAMEDALR